MVTKRTDHFDSNDENILDNIFYLCCHILLKAKLSDSTSFPSQSAHTLLKVTVLSRCHEISCQYWPNHIHLTWKYTLNYNGVVCRYNCTVSHLPPIRWFSTNLEIVSAILETTTYMDNLGLNFFLIK